MRRLHSHCSALFCWGAVLLAAAGGCSAPRAGAAGVPVIALSLPPHVRDSQSATTVLPERMLGHITLLAHDELGGRGTGSRGGDLAAGYIAGEFAAAGLAPGGSGGTYFQNVEARPCERFKSMFKLPEGTPRLTRNVVGILPGAGPHKSEYVVVGAHYDHLGVRDGKIYNGADDNASGVASIIEAAWALSGAPLRDRGVIIVAFAAEEIGLLGSEYFVEHSPVPMDSIVAMINVDMIGRLDPYNEMNMLAVHGLDTGASFREIVGRDATRLGLRYIADPSALGPSDHQNFYLAGVPALFFFTGLHEDYHAPGDDAEKINAGGAAAVTDLVCAVALDLVNADQAPQFARVDRPAHIMRGAAPAGSPSASPSAGQ